MTQTKPFPCRVVLSITTGRLLTKPRDKDGRRDNGIRDIYEILGWMTGDDPFTHQLPRFADECKPWLLRWFPELAKVDELETLLQINLDFADQWEGDERRRRAEQAIEEWLVFVQGKAGLKDTYDVPRIPADDHDRIHPYDELVAMRGTDEGIVIVETDGNQ